MGLAGEAMVPGTGVTLGPMLQRWVPGAQDHHSCPWQVQGDDLVQLLHFVLQTHDRCLDREGVTGGVSPCLSI